MPLPETATPAPAKAKASRKKKSEVSAAPVAPSQPAYCFDLTGGTDPYLDFGGYQTLFCGPIPSPDGGICTPAVAAEEMRKAFFCCVGTIKEPMLPLPMTPAEFFDFAQDKVFFLAECVRVRSACSSETAWEALFAAIPQISGDYWYEKAKGEDDATS